jgi:hypothetical protein
MLLEKAVEKLMRKKAINLKAQLKSSNFVLDGTISIMDGLFKSLEREYFFLGKGTIDFEYQGKMHSFEFTNLGGKYFVQNYKTNPDYQRVANMITLNETLTKQKDLNPNSKIKL